MKHLILTLIFSAISVVTFSEQTDANTGASTTQTSLVATVTFSVSMVCQNCVDRIQKNIAFEKGVKDLIISLEDKTVTIKYRTDKTSIDQLKTAIEKLGYKVEQKK